jgi:2-methylcitrate dehydratase PrpD
MIENIGKPYFLESPGLGLKLHPCSAPQFLAADAALDLKHAHNIQPEAVSKIEVSIPPLRYQRHFHPEVKTGLRGKFAVNYVVAMAVLEGQLTIETFTDVKANEPRIQEFLRRVCVIRDESIPEPGTYCPVAVELKDGTRFTHTATIAKGHPENPMTEAEVMEKFSGNVKTVLETSRRDALMSALRRLESVNNVRAVVDLLKPG